ncbi:MAG: hypothetical protein ACUVWR_05985 [Anaerolineae bacterium]
MEGYRIFRAPAVAIRSRGADFAQRLPKDYSQAMGVALGFYLFGHLADLLTTIGFLQLGQPECNLIPGLVLQHAGLPGLLALKLVGALATAWIFWKLRNRFFTVVFTCVMAVLLIFVASINSLDVLEALAQAAG